MTTISKIITMINYKQRIRKGKHDDLVSFDEDEEECAWIYVGWKKEAHQLATHSLATKTKLQRKSK